MAEYQCCYLDDGRCHSEVTVEAADDAIALLKAEEMLAASDPSFDVMDVWQASRRSGNTWNTRRIAGWWRIGAHARAEMTGQLVPALR